MWIQQNCLQNLDIEQASGGLPNFLLKPKAEVFYRALLINTQINVNDPNWFVGLGEEVQ